MTHDNLIAVQGEDEKYIFSLLYEDPICFY